MKERGNHVLERLISNLRDVLGVAQAVRAPAKLEVAGSSPVIHTIFFSQLFILEMKNDYTFPILILSFILFYQLCNTIRVMETIILSPLIINSYYIALFISEMVLILKMYKHS